MKRITVYVIKSALCLIAIALLTISFIYLPQIASEFAETAPEYSFLHYPLLIGIWLTLIPFNIAVIKSLSLIDALYKGQANSKTFSTTLNIVSNSAITITALYMIGMTLLSISGAAHPGIMLFGMIVIMTCIVIASISTFIKYFIVIPFMQPSNSN